MRIAYAKLGRSYNLDPAKWSTAGGDADVVRLLQRLAFIRPNDEFVLLGRNSGERPQDVGLPENVTNPWTELRSQVKILNTEGGVKAMNEKILSDDELVRQMGDFDAFIVWLGQHGTSNSPIPKVGSPNWVDGEPTNPQVSFINYCAYIIRAINRWRDEDPSREEIWICPDVRNYIKCRDLKWPIKHPVLAQFAQRRQSKHERYEDLRTPEELGYEADIEGTTWVSSTRYTYSAVELTALPHPSRIDVNTEPPETAFGLIMNENRAYVARSRLKVMKDWIKPYFPDADVRGKWSDKSLKELEMNIELVPYEEMWSVLRGWRCTLTTPASGSGWATAKPWEAFAAGVVCFFHPDYDTQGHVIPLKPDFVKDADLRGLVQWLRVESPEQLKARVDHLAQDDDTWRWLVGAQRRYFERRFNEELGGARAVNERLENM